MQMTDSEILGNYRGAKNQKAQVKILADLNAVSEPEMVEKLRSLGVKVPGRAAKDLPAGVDWLRARQLYDEGQSDLEIAEQLGCSKQTLANWRKREGLHANYPKSRAPAKKTAQPETVGGDLSDLSLRRRRRAGAGDPFGRLRRLVCSTRFF